MSLSFFHMVLVYTLQLADDCFYVGRVKDRATLDSRIEQHEAGEGAEWTKLHPVIGIYHVLDDAKGTDEDAQVILLVAEHGVDKVRGGTFCTPVLTEAEAKILNKLADSSRGSCYHCHETGHCTNECPLSLLKAMSRGGDWICPDCGDTVFAKKDTCRCGKWKPKEYKKAVVEAGRKPDDWNCPACNDHQFAKNKVCRKCGTAKPTRKPESVDEKGESVTKPALKRPEPDEKKDDDSEPITKKARTEPDVKPGDWTCPGCDFHNYASRTVCFKCKKAKPLKDAEPIGTCAICLDKPVRVAVQPCGHMCYCETCAEKSGDKCPICRAPMVAKQVMFQ